MRRGVMTIGENCRDKERTLAKRKRSVHSRSSLQKGAWALVLLALGIGAGQGFLSAPFFAVQRVETGPYRFTDKQQLEDILAAAIGQNLWKVAGGEWTARIRELPWVREARVVRRLPAGLKVEIREWRPLLRVEGPANSASSTGSLVLLEDGRVLPFPAGLPAPALPMLTSVRLRPTDAPGVWRLAAPPFERLLELTAAIARSGLERCFPVEFVIVRSDGFAIDLGGQAGRLLVGKEDFGARLDMFLTAPPPLTAGAVVDLRFRNRISVTDKA
jgi:cell division septal protein FtsQ